MKIVEKLFFVAKVQLNVCIIYIKNQSGATFKYLTMYQKIYYVPVYKMHHNWMHTMQLCCNLQEVNGEHVLVHCTKCT